MIAENRFFINKELVLCKRDKDESFIIEVVYNDSLNILEKELLYLKKYLPNLKYKLNKTHDEKNHISFTLESSKNLQPLRNFDINENLLFFIF